jgi:23S rRNA pseudouridine1911/1915/1917 synthase
MEPTILYEDAAILAVNKPAGLVVHSDGKTKEPNLVEWLEKKYPQLRGVGEPGRDAKGEEVLRSGIVHRLDRGTSGVMLVAKTQEAFEFLKKQFQDREVGKTYHAIVVGEMKTEKGKEKGKIDRPIGRSSSDFRKWSAQRGARGEMREALTEYRVLEKGSGYSLVEAHPKTGRTHQIRVHFKAINYPLIGDGLYAPNYADALGLGRLGLHSYQVTFADLKGGKHTVAAPYPEDFKKAAKALQGAK